jgi:hypothetical protein
MIRPVGKKRAFTLIRRKCRPLTQLKAALSLGLLVSAVSSSAIAEEARTTTANIKGIEHVLYLAIRPDPASPLLRQANGHPIPIGQPVMAKFVVGVRISAHSQETNFFGVVPATVSEFDLTKGSKEQPIWRDGKCHHERGFPKITAQGVEGSVTSGQEKRSITARWRVLGLFLPRDEVLASRRMDSGTDNIGPYIATRTETKLSRLYLDLKLYILPCDLTVAPQHGAEVTGSIPRRKER